MKFFSKCSFPGCFATAAIDLVMKGLGDPTCNQHRHCKAEDVERAEQQLLQLANARKGISISISPVLAKLRRRSVESAQRLYPAIDLNLRKQCSERGICGKCGQIIGTLGRFKAECQTCGTKIVATSLRPAANTQWSLRTRVHRLLSKQKKTVKELFDYIDTDGSGDLDGLELQVALHEMGCEVTTTDIEYLVSTGLSTR
jgi:hypothetical protein